MLTALFACAHATFQPRIETLGAPTPTAELVRDAAGLEADALAKVRVAYGTLPPGVWLDDDELRADPARYDLLARVSTDYDFGEALGAGLDLWFYRYDRSEGWKNAWCNAQVPLGWLTLTMWVLVPTHYPCAIAEGNAAAAVDRRRARIVEALVRATSAAGGDTLVVTSLGDLRIDTVNQYGAVLSSSTLRTTGGAGYALKSKAPSN